MDNCSRQSASCFSTSFVPGAPVVLRLAIDQPKIVHQRVSSVVTNAVRNVEENPFKGMPVEKVRQLIESPTLLPDELATNGNGGGWT
jgi:hypothetical protein